MPVPSPRNSIRIARGNYADLLSNITEIGEGELCFALDQDKFYSKAGGSLVAVGGGTELYSIAQLGDVDVAGAVNGQVLVYDATEDKWVPADQSGGGGEVDSVNGQTGVVVLNASDVGAPSDSEFSTLEGRVQANEVAQGNNIAKNNEQDGRLDSLESDVSNIDTFSGDYNDLSNKPSIPSNLDDLVDVNAPSPSSGQFLQWSGSEWTPGAASGAPVDSVNGQTGAVVLDADDISDAATTNKYATQAELDKLAGIEANAQVNTVSSVNTQTGDVVLTSSDVGLGNVDNTSDADKPISTATQAALGSKADLINGVVPNSQLPSIAITEYLGEAADETAMLALDGQKGDWCIRTDTSSTWVVTGDDAAELASWTELATPASAVTSVNGYTGTVVLSASDVGAAPSTVDLQQVTDNGNSTTNGAAFGGEIAYVNPSAGGKSNVFSIYNSGNNTKTAPTLQMDSSGNFRLGPSVETAPTISFTAADGSGSFAGTVESGGGYNDTTGGVSLFPTGGVISSRPNGSADYVWQGFQKGVGVTSEITANGSANFAGSIWSKDYITVFTDNTTTAFSVNSSAGDNAKFTVNGDGKTEIGGSIPGAANITLNADGSANFVSRVNIGASDHSDRAVSAYNNARTVGAVSAANYDPSGILFQGYSASVDDSNASIEIKSDGSIRAGGDPTDPHFILNGADGSASFAGTVNSSENTITGTWDLSAGNFWTCGAITIPNPTNATTGTSGLIRLTAAPTGWGSNIKHPGGSAETISSFPAVVPFYVQSSSVILLGKATQGIA